ncbi:uncharacterized protein LOC119394173 isoform X1 [Rhipicephalus sanguineus]|uniref:uncharacterized protein LOC119394173 isoform X1 n=1 Tax=Rhipicephalus sanguineus TaxID=34632 RepID=UPI001892E57A|nr:uncharacterized protein LOC119394173 isoform X1 [Rhipicephalus sanguineus]
MFPLQNQGVAMLVGFLMGAATVWLLETVSVFGEDSAITVIVCGTYFAYFFLENVRSSGVTGVVVYTMTVNSHRLIACTGLSRSLEDYWDMLYDVTGTLATCVSASYTAVLLIQYASTLDWKALWTCYVIKVAIRCVAVVVLYPVIGHFGYQVTVRQAMVLAWTSVKGTFLASIATMQHMRRENVYTESITKSYLYAIGDMVLTQLINVTFLPVVLSAMGVLEVSDVELRTMRDAVQYLKEATDSARALYMKDDSFLLADWRWVTRSTIVRNPLEATFRFQSAMSTGCVVRLQKVPRHIDTLAVENVLRIEQVSYARQYRQGIIQRRTKLTLIAALQYPFDKKVYLDMDIIGSILAIPKWVFWLKENLGTVREKGLIEDTYSGSDVVYRPLRERVVELFEHAYYEVVVTSSTLAVVFVLAGLVRIVMLMPRSNAFIGAITVEALYLTMFTTEVTIMLLLERMADVMHRYLDEKIYDAYEIGHAIVTGEEEVQQSVWKFVNNDNITADIRARATLNRLLVLRRLVEIQSRFPDIMVAFRSRQASTTILDDVTKNVQEHQAEGLLDTEAAHELRAMLKARRMRIIAGPCSLPTSYKPIAMLRVIPWIDSDSVRQFLAIQIRPVSFAPQEVIVERGEENPILLTYSGILKIEGEFENPRDGSLPNSVSQLFFYNEGYFLDYVSAPACLGVLGLVTDEPSITRVVAETQINAYVVPRERVMEAIQIFTRPPSFIFQIWSYIARIIAFMVLQTQPKYQTWPLDKISRRLESFLLPDLERCSKFNLTAEIEDAILIQGTALDPETQDYFVAPIYLPSQAMKITFPFYQERIRPVMLIIASKDYKLPPEVDWLQTKGDDEMQNEYEENFKIVNTTAERGDDLTEKVLSHRQSMDLY